MNFNPLEGDMLAFVGIGTGGAFTWRGAFTFTGAGGMEGRFDEVTNMLHIDLDGDGTSEMAFFLPGFPPEGFDGNAVIWA